MTFAWDWLLNNMISSGITDYYQLNVCINHCDFMLYRLGRDKGALLTEAHIIHTAYFQQSLQDHQLRFRYGYA